MTALQLLFTNRTTSNQTPLFEDPNTKDEGFELQTIEIDQTRQIRQISLKVSNNCCLNGLRLIDEMGDYIVDVTWST